MAASPLPVDYALPSEARQKLTLGDYLFHLFASALFLVTLSAPMWSMARAKRAYEDFGLKLPPATQALFDLQSVLESAYAQYWVWVLPFLVPLVVGRVSPAARRRWCLILVLLAALSGIAVTTVMQMPLWTLIEGITGSTGGGKR